MKKATLLLFILPLTLWCQVKTQTNFGLELAERDSAKSALLKSSIDSFLTEALSGDYSHAYVDSNHRKRYDFFFRKLSKIGYSSDEITFNAPNILKSYTPDGKEYWITVAYTGERNGEPFVFQLTELKMLPYEDHYRFYCTFPDKVASFKSKTFSAVNYHYATSINTAKAQEFANFKQFICKEAGIEDEPLDYYCFESLNHLLKAYGFLYSARQCNFLCYDLGFTENEGNVYVTGTNNENYQFGFIGEYMYYKLPNEDEMYWPFVQGISTYYGGYGLSSENMNELKAQFRAAYAENPEMDFLEAFQKGRKSSVNRHFSYYVMSAFLCEKALQEEGFDAVLKIAYSGSDGQQFFKVLDKTIGVNKDNFHQTILDLIEV
jgi:hypothetical protein